MPVTQRRTKVYFDGGCRPNPGPIEIAVVIRGEARIFENVTIGNNTDAEWLALTKALEISQALGLQNIELIGDAREIIQNANKALQGDLSNRKYTDLFLTIANQNPPSRIRWIKREQNLAGIALAARHPR